MSDNPKRIVADGYDRIGEPGGLFLATMGAGDTPDAVQPEWLGVAMFFSHFDAQTNRRLVEQAGLRVLQTEIVIDDEDGPPVSFLWVLAQKR